MIVLSEISADEMLARRVVSYARSFAPCLDTLTGEAMKNAVAILAGVADEAESRGSRQVASERVGSASVGYRGAGEWFTREDIDSLKALCGVGAGSEPVGEFPRPSRALHRAFDGGCDEVP